MGSFGAEPELVCDVSNFIRDSIGSGEAVGTGDGVDGFPVDVSNLGRIIFLYSDAILGFIGVSVVATAQIFAVVAEDADRIKSFWDE